MAVRRLKLLDAEIIEREEGGYEAAVKLRFQEKNYLGITQFTDDNEQAQIDSLAKATVEALKEALPIPVDVYLRKALKMNPAFLSDNLLVVIVDMYVDLRKLELTGCCVCTDKDLYYGVARATLDSTNRIVDYLLSRQSPRAKTKT
ncbi:MAG: hypothetical protein HY819_24815 [Acidobacteria bacterium]|nr:hypothetical protein [Acidobacteriota bacterium]